MRLEIHHSRLAEFTKTVNSLKQRAAKLGVPELIIEGGDTILKPVYDWRGEIVRTLSGKPIKDLYYVYELSGLGVYLDGYEFVGAIEHSTATGMSANLVKLAPHREIYEAQALEYKDAPPTCDHCRTVRARNMTYLVAKHGEITRVGSSCVDDFLGSDALSRFQLEMKIAELGEYGLRDENAGFAGFAMEDVLVATRRAIVGWGWKSKSSVEFTGDTATATLVNMALTERLGRDFTVASSKWPDINGTPATEQEIEFAARVAAFAAALPGDTSYAHNVRTIFSSDLYFVRPKDLGIVCSAVAAYNRSIADEIEKKAAAPSEWIGKVGEKVRGLKLKVVYANQSDGAYGPTTLLKFRTEGGDVVTWWASGSFNYEVGDSVIVDSATIKACGSYNSVKETTITRARTRREVA